MPDTHGNLRTPFGPPLGWFALCRSGELAAGTRTRARLGGRDLVVWRGAGGAVSVADAYCPHLGAHLGTCGAVLGDELACGFHGWQFGTDGSNTSIPYSSRTNGRARLSMWPAAEAAGMVLAWHDPLGRAPRWQPVGLPAGAGWRAVAGRTHEIAAPWHDLAENAADAAHFRFVHRTPTMPTIDAYEWDGHVATMRSTQTFLTPQGEVQGRIDSTTWGPGQSLVRFSGMLDAEIVSHTTPTEADASVVRMEFRVPEGTNPHLADAFVAEIGAQIAEDRLVWENKAYLTRPALAPGERAITSFRRWAAQFHTEDRSGEASTWPPAELREGPGGDTASRRLGG